MTFRPFVLTAAFAAGCCLAQQPQISVHLDAWPNVRTSRNGESIFRWYTDTGRYSTASLTVLTEVGFRAFISERLQRIQGDTDNELFNEYYLEDTGYWRIGKQLLPFGQELLEREYVRAARANTNLAVGGWPVAIAWCDAGPGRQTGVVARVGGSFGASVAAGEHFGIAGTAFNDIRKPEAARPVGTGYRFLLGADVVQHVGRATFAAEWVRTRNGHTATDNDNDLGLLNVTYDAGTARKLSFAWARDIAARVDSFRVGVQLPVTTNVELLPGVRWRGGRLFETSLELHYKL
jgi:hypothetical protein